MRAHQRRHSSEMRVTRTARRGHRGARSGATFAPARIRVQFERDEFLEMCGYICFIRLLHITRVAPPTNTPASVSQFGHCGVPAATADDGLLHACPSPIRFWRADGDLPAS